ncbi:putative lyase [Photobacterium piscicola]|uniref:Putative lyase n=2 Tax=Vibrionaceae TaxID=641 RepID=A0A1T5I1U0_9GAMM|nr:putative lyase [Photobacterium piscicola]
MLVFKSMERDVMSICRVDTVSIPVTDQNQALQFYRDVLGFELIRDHAENQQTRWVQLVPKGAETTISLVKPFAGMEAGGVQGLVVQTHDIQSTYQELSSRGVALSEIITMMEGRFATFNDPDGNGWVLIESNGTMLA